MAIDPLAMMSFHCQWAEHRLLGSPPRSSLNFLLGVRLRGRHMGTPGAKTPFFRQPNFRALMVSKMNP